MSDKIERPFLSAKVEITRADGRVMTIRFKNDEHTPIRGEVSMSRDAIEVPQEEAGWPGYRVRRPGPSRGEVHLGGLLDESEIRVDYLAALRSEVERLTRELESIRLDYDSAVESAMKTGERLTRERDEALTAMERAIDERDQARRVAAEKTQAEFERNDLRAERDSLSSQLAEARAKLGQVSGGE